jgi:ubiquinone/menaquinone biosynthesis C-methylase UbiE
VKVELPPQELAPHPDADDPVDYYYRPLTSRLYRARLHLAADLLGPGPLGSVLEVGYGAGLFLPELARRSERVVGIDVHDAVEEVEAMLRSVGVRAELQRGSVFELPFAGDEFDAVVCMSVLEHLRELDAALGEMRRVLRPGGVAVLGFPVRNPVTDTFFRLVGYDPRAIHPSSHNDILGAAKRAGGFEVERVLRFPRLFPTPLAAYVACRVRAR